MIANLAPYAAYKDSGVEWLGEVPRRWDVRRLATSVYGCINGTWGTDPNGSEDLPCIRVADFDRGRLRVRLSKLTFRAIASRERNHRLLKNGDLLIEKSGGGDLQPVGAVMQYDHDMEAVCSNFVARMPVARHCDAGYLTYLHSHLYAIRLNVRSIKQTTGIQNLDSSSYLGETVAIPPLAEQTAIARFLDHADRHVRRYIRAKERLIELLEEQRQVIIHQAVTGQIDVRTGQPYPAYKASRVDEFSDVPAHWKVQRIKTLFRLRTEKSGVAHGSELLSIYTHIGVRPRRELEEKGNKASTTDDYWIVKKGDLILNKLLAWMGAVGVSHYDGVTSPAYDILMPIVDLASDYYHYLFRTRIYLTQFKKRSKGIMDMRLRLYFDQLGQVLVPVPSGGEQQAIVEFLNESILQKDHIINRTRQQIEMLREYRTRLVADVVTGKLDVREAAAASPEKLVAPTNAMVPIERVNAAERQEEVAL